MSDHQHPSLEERLEVLRERLAPTIVRIAIQAYKDAEALQRPTRLEPPKGNRAA